MADETWAVFAASKHAALSPAAKRTVLAAASILAVFSLSVLVPAGGASSDRDRQVPSTPQNLHVVSATQALVSVAWNPSTDDVGVEGYYVFGDKGKATVDEPEYMVTELGCGQSTLLTVIAFDDSENRSGKATLTVAAAACLDTQPPAPPSGFTQLATSQDAVVLGWSPASDNIGVVAYGVYRDVQTVATPVDPSVALDGLACGATYPYAVDAVDAAGNRSARASVYVQTAACSQQPPPPSADTTPPSAPAGLAASNVTQSGLTLSWKASTDNVQVTGYDVYRNTTKVASPSSTSASVMGLACATSYTFAVAARDAAGNSSAQTQLTVATTACSTPPPPSADTTPPSAPSSLGISSATATSVALSWSPSTDNIAVVGYRTYVNGAYVSTTSQPGATVSGLSCGGAYTFEVDALDAEGNASARASVVGSTLACPDTQPPSAPAGVIATSRTATSIALVWSASSDNVGVAGYGSYRNGTRVATSSTTSAIFAGLTCNTNYTLAVDAYDAAGNHSSKSALMVSTTACPDTTPPSTPTGLAASNVSQTGLTLTWNQSTDNVGVTGYDIYRNGTKVRSTSATSDSQSGLTCNSGYSFAVAAYDGAGNRSSQASINPSTAACPTPANVGVSPPSTIKADCSSDVTAALLSWLATVPNNSTISFSANACYRIEGTLLLTFRHGLIVEGNGAMFRSFNPMTSGVYADGQRAMWRVVASTGIVFRNMTIDGAYTHGGTHDPSLQWAHAIDLRGSHADITNVTMTDLAGDCVFFGLNYFDEIGRSSGSVKDSTCLRTGRQAVSVTAANDVLVQRMTTDQVGYITFDVEPDLVGPGDGSDRVTFQDNTIGSYFLYAYAIVQNAPNNDQKFLSNQGTSTKGLRIGIIDPGSKGFRPQRVTISGNTATNSTQSPAIEARNVDTLTVTNNVMPTTTLLLHSGVTGLTFSGNTPNTKSP